MRRQKFYIVIILVLSFAFTTRALASLTFTTNAITGTVTSGIDMGAGNTLSLQTANNGPITTGTGLFTSAGNLRISDGTITVPSVGFTSETTMGMYRAGSGILGFNSPRFQFGPVPYSTGSALFTFSSNGSGNTAIFNHSLAGESRVTNEAGNGIANFEVINDNLTGGVPAALTSGMSIGGMRALGTINSAGGYSPASGLTFSAAENWSNSTQGSMLEIKLATIGTASIFNALVMTSAVATFVPPVNAPSYQLGSKLAFSSTTPTISSGFGASPSVTSGTSAAFRVNVGTGGGATSGVIGLPTATNGWNCFATDQTTTSATVFITKQTASTTASVTLGNFNTSGAAAAWVASDILLVNCTAF